MAPVVTAQAVTPVPFFFALTRVTDTGVESFSPPERPATGAASQHCTKGETPMPTDEEIHQTGEETNAQAAAAPLTGEPEPTVTSDAGEPGTEADKSVPLTALEDERRKRQAAEQQLAQYQQALMQQQAIRQAVQPQSTEQDILREMGVSPDDIYSEDGVRRLAQGLATYTQKQIEQETRRIRAEMQPQQFTDYTKLVGTQGPMGFQPAPALLRAMQDDPQLQNDLVSMTDPARQQRAAYRAARAAQKIMDLEANAAPGTSPHDIAATVAATTAPMSPAAVGAGGAFTRARELANMSDEEFERMDREAAGT
jgi:hypothetical protein